MEKDLAIIVSVIGFIFQAIAWIYIVSVIPKRIKNVDKKIDVVTKNQTIIEKKINK